MDKDPQEKLEPEAVDNPVVGCSMEVKMVFDDGSEYTETWEMDPQDFKMRQERLNMGTRIGTDGKKYFELTPMPYPYALTCSGAAKKPARVKKW